MRKVPTLYVRNPEDRRFVTSEVNPHCKWVLDTPVTPSRKFDGTCMMLDDDQHWWGRREVKPGKPVPAEFVLAEHDASTGKTVGWVPLAYSSFAQFMPEALMTTVPDGPRLKPGTYELCGPKINGNPEDLASHILIPHGDAYVPEAPKDYDGLAKFFATFPGEGLVWKHPEDGRMAKLKAKDFPQ